MLEEEFIASFLVIIVQEHMKEGILGQCLFPASSCPSTGEWGLGHFSSMTVSIHTARGSRQNHSPQNLWTGKKILPLFTPPTAPHKSQAAARVRYEEEEGVSGMNLLGLMARMGHGLWLVACDLQYVAASW